MPTRGVERWLSQRLSHRLGVGTGRADGVCANFVFPFPGTLVTGATARASGLDPAADPWPPARSVWPLLRLVDDHLAEPFLRSLAAHLRAASAGGHGPAVRHRPSPGGPVRPLRGASTRHDPGLGPGRPRGRSAVRRRPGRVAGGAVAPAASPHRGGQPRRAPGGCHGAAVPGAGPAGPAVAGVPVWFDPTPRQPSGRVARRRRPARRPPLSAPSLRRPVGCHGRPPAPAGARVAAARRPHRRPARQPAPAVVGSRRPGDAVGAGRPRHRGRRLPAGGRGRRLTPGSHPGRHPRRPAAGGAARGGRSRSPPRPGPRR